MDPEKYTSTLILNELQSIRKELAVLTQTVLNIEKHLNLSSISATPSLKDDEHSISITSSAASLLIQSDATPSQNPDIPSTVPKQHNTLDYAPASKRLKKDEVVTKQKSLKERKQQTHLRTNSSKIAPKENTSYSSNSEPVNLKSREKLSTRNDKTENKIDLDDRGCSDNLDFSFNAEFDMVNQRTSVEVSNTPLGKVEDVSVAKQEFLESLFSKTSEKLNENSNLFTISLPETSSIFNQKSSKRRRSSKHK